MSCFFLSSHLHAHTRIPLHFRFLQILEFEQALGKLGYEFSQENIESIISIVDDNGDGELNFEEFLGFYDFLDYLKVRLCVRLCMYVHVLCYIACTCLICDCVFLLYLLILCCFFQFLFESADDDKNGSINREELKLLLQKANYKFNDKQVELMYR